MSLEEKLADGLEEMGLHLDAATQSSLLNYVALMQKWNKVYNLTAVRDPQKMIIQHLLDSLAVLPHLVGRRIIDVGTGPGLPGIPLALANPALELTLLDSNHKKTSFLRQVCLELNLNNVTVVCERVEAWRPTEKYDVVISRAFSDLAEFVSLALYLCSDTGLMLAMKGIYPHEELTRLPATVELQGVESLKVPGLDAERHLVLLRPTKMVAKG
ncbi:MAG: 16S rRNA (guanine(527)-N(7))-methyltransferase RsmG [Hydrogenophilales bacterium CG_4_9_14_3_um_filter_59_35]|nr:MAG: 16S rRNA (guanine(527)-N(7))-methyltransferase RsmG [Hydrogenophilales bacterium CG18_big_fil_WC_8_21_14_2_50_58_12]PIX99849.1 MAG: 16S rRNA (guanine(527)-N(7))-methyltransferase RsmG [Hydrogenophilales bacterium CG_4_10_14_3_um_filter_58_23]PJB04547.1 MAG: 16S rRNA (guanine(527)-N(7))-methyltransferase RsmG [Hydrogenophilales bacterium CG_4_9_14_3_um_filter_59_35]